MNYLGLMNSGGLIGIYLGMPNSLSIAVRIKLKYPFVALDGLFNSNDFLFRTRIMLIE